jgi:hypothetical protein
MFYSELEGVGGSLMISASRWRRGKSDNKIKGSRIYLSEAGCGEGKEEVYCKVSVLAALERPKIRE